MEEYSIERLSSDRFDVLFPLMKDCFGTDGNMNYFKWKFLENPVGEFTAFVAVHNESREVVSFYGIIPELFNVNGKERILFQTVDGMTHSKHRRKGLFQMLGRHCYEYLKKESNFFVFGFGGVQSTPALCQLGWRKIFDMRYLFIPKIRCISSRKTLNFNDFKEVDAKEVFHLAQKKQQYSVNSIRTEDHFIWRLSNPLNPCKIICCNRVGYAAFYTLGDKLFLFDYYFPNKLTAKKLINYLKSEVKANSLKGIITIAKDSSDLMKELKRMGFWINPFSFGPLNTKIPFIFYSDKVTMESLSDASLWNISPYEHDAL
jgi:hypothetical protein